MRHSLFPQADSNVFQLRKSCRDGIDAARQMREHARRGLMSEFI
jgi:hypothetical protein